LPLIYAPETLPEKILKENDLKKYVEKALEKVQKNLPERKRKKLRLLINLRIQKTKLINLMRKPENWLINTIK